ncbi:ricin-type beta-trefoil lectin domain protein [Streptomyces sp. NPDC051664]|uniref:ricin-type beta-trefoil lectin domain protein n=1 Tax=Streptomyces sp. NPDC051664 TaxID=3365668 RepID=UPI00378A2D5D
MNLGSKRCLASQGGSDAVGTRMVLADCDTSDPSQGWTFDSDGTARDFAGAMCLDTSAAPGTGAPVVLAVCSPARQNNQNFKLKSSYDLVDVQPDLCVDAQYKGTSAGTLLQLWKCEGTSNQKWRHP